MRTIKVRLVREVVQESIVEVQVPDDASNEEAIKLAQEDAGNADWNTLDSELNFDDCTTIP